MFGAPPDLSSSPIVGSYGSHWSHGSHRSYGTAHAELERLSSRASWGRRGEENSEEEVPPMLVKEIEQDGKFVLAVEGQSTLPQTIFNSIKCASSPSPTLLSPSLKPLLFLSVSLDP